MLRFGATIKGNVVVAFADHRLPANESIGAEYLILERITGTI
jgi:hypothetical protein